MQLSSSLLQAPATQILDAIWGGRYVTQRLTTPFCCRLHSPRRAEPHGSARTAAMKSMPRNPPQRLVAASLAVRGVCLGIHQLLHLCRRHSARARQRQLLHKSTQLQLRFTTAARTRGVGQLDLHHPRVVEGAAVDLRARHGGRGSRQRGCYGHDAAPHALQSSCAARARAVAGASASAPLVSTTVPLTGLYTSDAACAAQQTQRNASVAPHAAPAAPRSPRRRAADRSERPRGHAARGPADELPRATAALRLRKLRVLLRAWRRTRLDGLDHAEGLARRQRGAHLRQLHVHHVAQLALRRGKARVSDTSRVAASRRRAVAREAFGTNTRPLPLLRAETRRFAQRRLPRHAAGALAVRSTRLRVVGDADGADVTLHLHPLHSGRSASARQSRGGVPDRGAARTHLVALRVLQAVDDCKCRPAGRGCGARQPPRDVRGRRSTLPPAGARRCDACERRRVPARLPKRGRKGAPLE